MSAKVEDQSASKQVTECHCREQIADILKRLEALENGALIMQKVMEMEPAKPQSQSARSRSSSTI